MSVVLHDAKSPALGGLFRFESPYRSTMYSVAVYDEYHAFRGVVLTFSPASTLSAAGLPCVYSLFMTKTPFLS